MSGRRAKRERRKANAMQQALAMQLANYWFHRQYPDWQAMEGDQVSAILRERYLKICEMTDEQRKQMLEATTKDITRQDLIRKMSLRQGGSVNRSEEHTSELQSHSDLRCRLLL